MNNVFISDTEIIALFLKLLWSSCENWEGVEVHWDNSVGSWQEVLDGISGFSWSHAEAVTNWEKGIIWFIEFIDKLHVGEDVGITGVIDSEIMIWDIDDETTGLSTSDLDSLRSDTSRWVISVNHGYLAKTKIFGTTFLHFSDHWAWNFSEELIVSSDLRGAYNLSLFSLTCHHQEWSVH